MTMLCALIWGVDSSPVLVLKGILVMDFNVQVNYFVQWASITVQYLMHVLYIHTIISSFGIPDEDKEGIRFLSYSLHISH